MDEERNDLVLRLLREMRYSVDALKTSQDEFRKEMHSMRVRVEEMHETSITALGLAGHANVQHQTVRGEIDDLKERVKRLEERLPAE